MKFTLTAAALLLTAGAASAQTETIIYTTNAPTEGTAVLSGLYRDKTGHLYGVAQQGGANDNGTAFRINPPAVAGGADTATVIWTFSGTDANGPSDTLLANSAGNLFGTSRLGGKNSNGVVFMLGKPKKPSGAWTETNIYDEFNTSSYGNGPIGSLVAGTGGVIYGVTKFGGGVANAGLVFQITPPATAGASWTPAAIWHFAGGAGGQTPIAGLVRASTTGVLYGTTNQGGGSCNCGVVYGLTPPATAGAAWTQTILHTFAGADGSYPAATLTLSGKTLYGTTSNGGAAGYGTVFQLQPGKPGKPWKYTVLWSFSGDDGSGPYAPVIRDTKGNLFGTTNLGGSAGFGTVFRVSPPAAAGGVWTEAVLHSFAGNGVDGYQPFGGLTADSAGNLFGATRSGGVSGGDSTIYQISGGGYVP